MRWILTVLLAAPVLAGDEPTSTAIIRTPRTGTCST